MKLTDYIDCLTLRHLKRYQLEKRYIELIKKYEELEESTISRYDSYFYTGIAFLLGISIPLIIFNLGGFIQ